MASVVTLVLGVQRAFQAIQVHRVRLVRRALKGTLAHEACKAFEARRALRDPKETEVQGVVATGALRVHKAMKVLPVTKASQGQREEALLDLKEARESEESQVGMDRRENKAPWVTTDTPEEPV